jgi:DNA-binding HxlR family transcriptional regulator
LENDSNILLRKQAVCLCIFEGITDVIGKKWSLNIINAIGNHKRLKFNGITHELRNVSPKIFTETLRELESAKLIRREAFSEIPPRVEY